MSSAMARVYLERHGRTALHAERRLRWLSDPPLDEVGRAEGARLGDALATKHPIAAVSSPLQRTVATAEAIGRAAGAPVRVDVRLNDCDSPLMTGYLRVEVGKNTAASIPCAGVVPVARCLPGVRCGHAWH